MRRTGCFLLLLFIMLLIVSCNDNSTQSTSRSKPFSLDIAVADTAGHAMPELMVSAWNHIENDPIMLTAVSTGGVDTIFNTTISFSLTTVSLIYLVIQNIQRDTITTFVQDSLPAGTTFLDWQGSNWAGKNRIYKIILSVYPVDSGSGLAYKDSIYAYYRPTAALWSKIGFTNASGKFQTDDSLLFPNLLSIPQMIQTDESSDSVGELAIDNIVTIIVTDTANNLSQEYVRDIISDSNSFVLIWDPVVMKQPAGDSEQSDTILLRVRSTSMSSSTVGYKLYQNFPNPFK